MNPDKSRQIAVDKVANGLRVALLLGKEYTEGQSISETEIAEQYDVSRSTVRSAFQLLNQEGLLEICSNGRKILHVINEKYIEDICFTRCLLECEAIRYLFNKDEIDYSVLFEIVGRLQYAEQLKDKEKQRELLVSNHENFHKQLFVLADNLPLKQCYESIASMVNTITRINSELNLNIHTHKYFVSHKQIAEMLMEKDEAIFEYVKYHTTEATKKDLLEVLRIMREK